jgi:hypothetical protein
VLAADHVEKREDVESEVRRGRHGRLRTVLAR